MGFATASGLGTGGVLSDLSDDEADDEADDDAVFPIPEVSAEVEVLGVLAKVMEEVGTMDEEERAEVRGMG